MELEKLQGKLKKAQLAKPAAKKIYKRMKKFRARWRKGASVDIQKEVERLCQKIEEYSTAEEDPFPDST